MAGQIQSYQCGRKCHQVSRVKLPQVDLLAVLVMLENAHQLRT